MTAASGGVMLNSRGSLAGGKLLSAMRLLIADGSVGSIGGLLDAGARRRVPRSLKIEYDKREALSGVV